MVPLAYDLTKTFKESDFEYSLERENTLFESLVKKLTDMIENLCRRGIVKTYYENDENIPYVKGKILFRENTVHNSILKHRTYCRYNEYGPDNIENRIIKYTLYYLTLMQIGEPYLSRKLGHLLRYFEPVSLKLLDSRNDSLKITYNRLTIQYKPIIDVCKLILDKSSVNLSSTGKIRFFSFLIDMNELFDFFVYRILSDNLNRNLTVRGGKKKIKKKIDTEKVTMIKPDIVVREIRGARSVVIDSKYEDKYEPTHLYQIWTYAIGLRIPVGVLVYPKNKLIESYQTTLKTTMTQAHILTIDLTKPGRQDFIKVCKEFVASIERIMGL
jgi:5-methylcytosine-specific restriction enzyme subunit McrC